jgi:inhibitor of cysteine peptidase
MDRRAERRGTVVLVVAVLAVWGLAGCGRGGPADEVPQERPAGEVLLDSEDDGRQVDLAVGQGLVVTLASNPTTGYSWQVQEGPGPVLAQVGEVEYREAPQEATPLVGAGGTETFHFEAKAVGQTRLVLEYRRPWEETVEPEDSFAVEVVVR